MIGYVEFEAIIYEAHSLKEKRAVLQRILTRLSNKCNVSVAEVGYQDLWQRTKLAVVTVSSSQAASEKEIQKALKLVDSFPEIERTITDYQWL
ncbi:DUF503 family protein [Bacillus sp. AGMB 02131]|uniref:DUF503 family protein n=1 Tax=Peribacillus faecalis TaxID=2772559 RepID=A0A927HB61_9BACI|nr:DUF503 family protein [Peribacillus faecalis]MBD3109400.1 DUF503 family protein [Peribacillus faecalis]